MTIEQAKEKLKKDGYTWFELSDFNSEFYSWILQFKCDENKNLKNKFKNLRIDINKNSGGYYLNLKNEFETHELASEKKSEINNLVELNNNKNLKNKLLGNYSDEILLNTSQMWYFSDLPQIIEDDKEIEKLKIYIKNLITYFFDFEEKQEYSLFAPTFTYYDKDCVLKNHSDGTGTGRICALLIYLNETYDENDGGILVLNNDEKVIPTFGKVTIIDLQTFDVPHMVTKVTGGIGRYAFLSFVKKKEDEYIHSKDDIK